MDTCPDLLRGCGRSASARANAGGRTSQELMLPRGGVVSELVSWVASWWVGWARGRASGGWRVARVATVLMPASAVAVASSAVSLRVWRPLAVTQV